MPKSYALTVNPYEHHAFHSDPPLRATKTNGARTTMDANNEAAQNNSQLSASRPRFNLAGNRSFTSINIMAKHGSRPRGESDLGRPALRPRAQSYGFSATSASGESTLGTLAETSYRGFLPTEILTAILLPLPFLLASFINPVDVVTIHSTHPSKIEIAEAILEEAASTALPVPTRIVTLVQACALTSGTLLLIGILGWLKQSRYVPDRKKTHLITPRSASGQNQSSLLWHTIRRILLRIICVGLPFLATAEIGGARTGLLLLSAAATGLISSEHKQSDNAGATSWKRRIATRKWSCLVFCCVLACDLAWIAPEVDYATVTRGYIALAKSIFFLQLPLPTSLPSFSRLTASRPASTSSTSAVPATPWEAPASVSKASKRLPLSPLICSRQDTNFTLIAGSMLGMITVILLTLLPSIPSVNGTSLMVYLASIGSATALLSISIVPSLQSGLKVGLLVGIAACVIFCFKFEFRTWQAALAFGALSLLSYVAVQLDTQLLFRKKHTDLNTHSTSHKLSHSSGSKVTRFLLRHTEDWPLLHNILSEKESRRILYFMFINLGFMFIQTFYALVAGSLGLLSDSIHMFFDCVGLLAGLVAAVMSKWAPNSRFPYGYGKVETLSGLGNGIFLMIISVEIIWESFERFLEGAELKRLNELLLVSIGGLLVNLIGLIFIGHAHHGHGHGHSHGHTRSHDQPHAHDTHNHAHLHSKDNHHDHETSLTKVKSHDIHAHHHGHANENMAGIYLHILADTMGSVAVIISTLLTSYTGWSGWDPIASCIIAILIIAASYPLVVGSSKKLLLTVPNEVEYALRSTLQEISGLKGVAGYAVPRFWLDDADADAPESEHGHHSAPAEHGHSHDGKGECAHGNGQKILGVIHVIAARNADLEDVRARMQQFLKERNMDVVVHVEREGQSRCWCGGEKHGRNPSANMLELPQSRFED